MPQDGEVLCIHRLKAFMQRSTGRERSDLGRAIQALQYAMNEPNPHEAVVAIFEPDTRGPSLIAIGSLELRDDVLRRLERSRGG